MMAEPARKASLENKHLRNCDYLTIRPVARKGYGSIAHEAKPNGLFIRSPCFSITQLNCFRIE